MKMKKNIKNKTNKNNSKKQSKLTSWIDQRNNDVQFNKRLGAYVLDWIIGGIFTGLPAVMMYGAITGKSDMFSDLYVFQALGFEAYWAYLAGALCIVFALFYYVYVPYKIYPGQTLAKKWLNIKIVMEDDSDVTLKALLLRQVVGLFLLESGSLVVCGYIRQMITLMLGIYVDYVWQWIGSIALVGSAMLTAGTNSHRSIHDYIAKTKVVLVK